MTGKRTGDKAGAPQWEPNPAPELLEAVAAKGDSAAFLDACRADADAHEGMVSVNRVRSLVRAQGLVFNPQAWSAFWSVHTGAGKPMASVMGSWEPARGSTSRNDGRPYRIRCWTNDSRVVDDNVDDDHAPVVNDASVVNDTPVVDHTPVVDQTVGS